MAEALRSAPEAGVTGRAVGGIDDFLRLLEQLGELAGAGPGEVLEAALERSGYLAELQAEHSVDADGRLENLAELVGFAREFETVDEFLEQVSLVADSPADYIAKAAALADDAAGLAALRTGLRPRMQRSPLCDGPAFARTLEQAYRSMWRAWCRQRPAP